MKIIFLEKTLCDNYLNGKYDLILNDFVITVEFEGLFALKYGYLLVSERTNKRFNLFKISKLNEQT